MDIVMILDIPGMFPVMFPVGILIMISAIPVMIPALTITCSCFRFMLYLSCIPVLTIVWFATLILYACFPVAWDKGICMRVSLFGLFLRCTSLMGQWLKRIQSLLLIISFTCISCFMIRYIRSIYYACVLTPFMSLSHLAVVHLLLYVLTPWICTFRFRS